MLSDTLQRKPVMVGTDEFHVRYTSSHQVLGQRAVVERMKKSNITFGGSLAFFNNWGLFWSSGKPMIPLSTQYISIQDMVTTHNH
jgi:hypothetical protein